MPAPHDRRQPPSLGTIRPSRGPAHGAPPPAPHYPGPGQGDFRGPRSIYRHAEREPRRVGLAAALIYGVLGLVALVVLAGAALLITPPTGLIRDRLIAEVKSRTGRELAIGGDTRLTLVPALGIALQDVTLSAPPAMPGAPLIHSESLEVQVALLPLLTREVTVERLILRRPVIELRVDAQGRRSWDFAEAGQSEPGRALRYAQVNPRGQDGRPLPRELQDFVKNSSGKPAAKGALAGVNDLTLADVRISDGLIRYADARQGAAYEAKGIDGRLSLKELAGPLEVSGQLTYAGERIAFDGRVASLKEALEERSTAVALKLAAAPLQASYEGTATAGSSPALDGRLSIRSPSLDAVARLAQVPIAGLAPLGALTLEGQVRLVGPSLALSGANLALGEATASGSVALETGGTRPLLKANLKLGTLDLNRLAAIEPSFAPASPATRAPSPPAAQAGRFAPPQGAPIGAARSIEDLLSRPEGGGEPTAPQPQVRGFTRRGSDGWSSEPLNPAALRLLDAEARLELAGVLWSALKIGPTQSAVQLKAGVLKIDIAQSELYGGRAKGLVSVDARAPELVVGANLSGDGLAMLGLLKDAAEVDMLDGRGRMIVAVSARGGSERELIGSLAGKSELRVNDGALVGWDASQMIGGIAQGRLPKLDRTASARTPFSELSATFQIANGVARNQDLKLESPTVRASGSGVINLVDRNINMLARPQLAGGEGALAGIEVPVRIAGPFDKVSVVPDVGGVLQSQPVQNAVKQLGKQLKDGDVEGVVRGVLGNDPKADEKAGKAKELLRQLLNR